MILTIIALVIATFLCFVFESTRLFGIVGVLILLYLNPVVFIACVACLAAIAVLIYFYRRSNANDVPRLPD